LVTATLGEVRHRADVVLFWRADPAATHPRHFERYSLSCSGEFTPNGRAGRTCVVVDSRPTATAAESDVFLQTKPNSDLAALGTLQAILKNDLVDAADVSQTTGIPLAEWQQLAERLKSARYGALFFDPSSASSHADREVLSAMFELVGELNQHTRFVALPIGGANNAAGASAVLTWQTGFPSAVDFADGSPRYDPEHSSAAAVLASGRVDAALVVAADSAIQLPTAAAQQLASIPFVSLGTAPSPLAKQAAVAFTVATPGIHTGGTVFRSDGVPLALRAALDCPYPTAISVLQAIYDRVANTAGVGV
jgi:formylmethanofuran dehydrogenase subunit B